MTRKVLAVCVVLLGLTSFSAAKTINVPNENCASIQCAIDFDDPCYPSYIAVDGDEIVVGPEWADPEVPQIYVAFGEGNRGIDFRGKAITVRSRYGPAYCIIDCEYADRAFSFHSGEFYDYNYVTETETGSVVKGFTIKNGRANFGGAIECITDSSPMIRDCIFTGNRAYSYGGAIECYGASPEIFNCLFYDNSSGGYGGAIDCEDASPRITNCTFDDNRADIAGGGGGIFSSWYSLPHVQDSIFRNCSNHAIHEYVLTTQGDVKVNNCLFFGNQVDYYDADTESSYTGRLEIQGIPDDPERGDIIDSIYDTDPLFVKGPLREFLPEPLGNYYLSQIAAGQSVNSPCLNGGHIWYTIPFPLDADPNYTTRTDNVQDTQAVDLGYHYRQSVLPQKSYWLVTEVETVNGAEGTIDPNHPLGHPYTELSIVGLTADPNEDSIVSRWSGGTEYDGPTGPSKDMPQGRTDNRIEIIEDKLVPGTDEIRVAVEFNKRPRRRLTVTPGEGGRIEVFTEPIGGTEDLFYEWKSVVVDAIPDDGYVVKNWTGLNLNPYDPDRDATDLYMTRAWITMHDDREDVGVEFITDYVELTVLYNLEGGEVYPRRGRYPYPGPGVDPYEVELTAYPNTNTNPSYRLESWSGTDDDNSTALINSVTMNEDKTVEVLFATVPNHWLTIDIEPDSQGHDNGTVQMLPPQPDNGYPEGTQVQLLPHAGDSYAAEWLSGYDSFDPNGAWVTIMGPTTVSVKFIRTNLPGGERICVYAPGPDGEPDWAAGPKGCYPTIQDAIDASVGGTYGPLVIEGDPDATPLPIPAMPEAFGDIVVVGDGVYTGPGNRDLDFHGKLITVRSEVGPDECIIDCQGAGRAFVFPGVAPSFGDVVLDPVLGIKIPGAENNGAVID
ncbi:MAG: InlB B-repeat-containing protein, partial [Planctomycetota bacterium]